MTSGQPSSKPKIRAPAIWRKRDCQCRQRVLLCFGVPMLPPSITLVAVAYGTDLPFGVFHALGLALISVSVICIVLAVVITLYRKHITPKDNKKVGEGPEEPPLTARSVNSVKRHSGGSVEMVKVAIGSQTSLVSENEKKHKKHRKTAKRKHRKQRTKLAPVKEEDGRARFEMTMAEREKKDKKSHKRTKSESRHMHDNEEVPVVKVVQPLTKEHLRLLDLFNSQGSPQLKRSRSMSDIGDSASERIASDFPTESSIHRKSPGVPTTSQPAPAPSASGSTTARPILIHTSTSRTGVRASRFSSIL